MGQSFAADVIKRSRQLILVLRETVTSYTSSQLLQDERHQTLRDALIQLCIYMRPMDGPPAIIRTDTAPGFKALMNDKSLHQHRITLELGHAKNPNKNPVAERAIQELEFELLRQEPLGGAVSSLTLAIAALNSRIRSRGLSSREMWTQRDQFSNAQIPLGDNNLIATLHEQRRANHQYSERSKVPLRQPRPSPLIDVGDLVYLHSDSNKSRAQDRYLVVSVDPPFCNIKKFVGSQLRSSSYRVKLSECFRVPVTTSDPSASLRRHSENSVDEDDLLPELSPPPSPPDIPDAISAPAFHGSTPTQELEPPALPGPPPDSLTDQAPHNVDVLQGTAPEPVEVNPSADDGPRRTSRSCRPPARFADYVTDF